MLFNILLVLLVIYVCLSPLLVVRCIKFGIKISEDPKKASLDTIFNVPKKKTHPKMTAEEKRRADILENIGRYDGTPNGQKPIEVKHE